jgi:tetratricopeptide (TPR) repeat protein
MARFLDEPGYLTVGIVPVVMPAGFPELVGRLAEAMGQRLDAVKGDPDGIRMRTSDGFLFAFLEDPTRVSLAQVQRLLEEVGPTPARLVVLTPGRLPLAIGGEILEQHATLVEGSRFLELVRGLGLGEYLGDEPRRSPSADSGRLLPSAHMLDSVMQRARSWSEWGVPALSLRFYRQAATLKPEFAPARVGIGQALLGLGLTSDARRAFEEALQIQTGSLDARLGLAAVLGAEGRVEKEIEAYRELLSEDANEITVRAHLVAALIAQGHWGDARDEIARMLQARPEDPQMRFLHSVALEKTGAAREATAERDRARRLGLDPARERSLCVHLGLPVRDIPPAAPADSPARDPEPTQVPTAPSRPARPPSKGATPPRKRAAGRRAPPRRSPGARPRSTGRKPK